MVRYPKPKLRDGSPQIALEGGNIQTVEQRMSYNKYGQKVWVETPEGEVTLFLYYPETDPDGDGQDIRSGNSNAGVAFDTSTGGFLKETILDYMHSTRYRGSIQPLQISIKQGYDPVGNVAWLQDGRGIKQTITFNKLNQIVEISRASDASASGDNNLTAYSYKSRLYYDYNNNIVKSEIEYRDGNNPDLPQWIETIYVYDILNNILETTSRVNNNSTITKQFRYDGNTNLVSTVTPIAVAGIQPNNKLTFSYAQVYK